MTDPLDLVHEYLRAIEAGNEQSLVSLLDPTLVYRELPNRLVPEGSLNDRSAMLRRFAQGQKILRSQRYEIVNALVAGDAVCVEVSWTGVLAVPMGSLKAGDEMRAFSAIFIEVRAGKIVAQRNYDCIPPF